VAKKKARRRRKAPTGVDPNERRRERLEARRQQKAEALAAKVRAERRQRFIRNVLLLGLAALVVWFLFFRGGLPSEINGHPIETFSTAGAGDHTDQTVQYESAPPVSGSHNPSPAPCGVHAEQIQNELQVHSLEHGAVGIQYDPTLDPQTIKDIEAIVRDYDKDVFSGPYSGMDTPIAVTAWAHMMRLDTLDATAVREFIDVFAGNGDAPEASSQDCPNDSDDSFKPGSAPSPGATIVVPGESPSP
jgi:hypothetical protein